MEQKYPNRIQELRDSQRPAWSLRDLAQRSGISHTKLHRIETGITPPDFNDLRQIAGAFGVRLSALLIDEDVEIRLDENGTALVAAVAQIPPDDRPDAIHAAFAIVKFARAMAAAGALRGEEVQVSALAETWNAFRPQERAEALDLWRIARLGKASP